MRCARRWWYRASLPRSNGCWRNCSHSLAGASGPLSQLRLWCCLVRVSGEPLDHKNDGLTASPLEDRRRYRRRSTVAARVTVAVAAATVGDAILATATVATAIAIATATAAATVANLSTAVVGTAITDAAFVAVHIGRVGRAVCHYG